MLLFRQSDLQFLSTLSLRRATGGKQSFIRMDRIFLSTLSLRRATGLAGKVEDAINISIHALLAESDRGAGADRGGPVPHFYPRSPCGERHLCPGAACSNKLISIHALLAESDFFPCVIFAVACQFLSTLSLRRATPRGFQRCLRKFYFYPRSPCGERPHQCRRLSFFPHFYPRSPCGERPRSSTDHPCTHRISIHALLAESDQPAKQYCVVRL